MSQPEIVTALDPLFNPRSVAVVGASNNKIKWGYSTFSSLLDHYKGDIYPVNNRDAEVLGHTAYSKVTDIPGPVDLVVIVVPEVKVAGVMEDCVKKGVKAGVIITAGFAEVGPQGKAMQDEVMRIARKGGIRLVGPNCMGMWSASSNLTAFMFPMKIMPGPLALVSQGGNIGGALVADAVARGVGFRQYVSCGCTADIPIEDYIEYLGHDDAVKVIMVYIEGLGQRNRFVEKVRKVTLKKPVLVVKPGKTDAAAKAISSHSGALSGSDSIYDAVFKESGVIRTENTTELLDVALAMLNQPLPRGRNVVITTPGGSYGVMCAEACALRGLNVIDLPAAALEKFNTMFPARWSHGNPVDPAGDRDIVQYLQAPQVLLPYPEVDALIFMGFGTFSSIAAVFGGDQGGWRLDRFKENEPNLEKIARSAVKIIDSGDRSKMIDLLKVGLNLMFGWMLATEAEEMDEFIDTISDSLTSEKMMKGSFFKNLKALLETVISGEVEVVPRAKLLELMEPILDAQIGGLIKKFNKPVITTTFTETTATISEGGYFPYPNTDRASTVLAKLVEYREYLEKERKRGRAS